MQAGLCPSITADRTNGLAYHKCCSIRSATLREKDSAPYPGQLQGTQRNLGGRDSRVECVFTLSMSLQLAKGGKMRSLSFLPVIRT